MVRSIQPHIERQRSHRCPALPSKLVWGVAADDAGRRRRGGERVPAVSGSRPLHRPAVGPSPRRSPQSIRTAAHAMHPLPISSHPASQPGLRLCTLRRGDSPCPRSFRGSGSGLHSTSAFAPSAATYIQSTPIRECGNSRTAILCGMAWLRVISVSSHRTSGGPSLISGRAGFTVAYLLSLAIVRVLPCPLLIGALAFVRGHDRCRWWRANGARWGGVRAQRSEDQMPVQESPYLQFFPDARRSLIEVDPTFSLVEWNSLIRGLLYRVQWASHVCGWACR